MKIFIGQAVTGEDIENLKDECSKVQDALSKAGHESYCTILEGNEFENEDAKMKLEHAFEEIDKSDAFLAIIRGEKRSEGMLMEIGYTLSKKKKLIVAIKKEVRDKTYVDELADQVIEFEDINDLCEKLGDLK